jgi:GNAT superfamily N-acetyltransferase
MIVTPDASQPSLDFHKVTSNDEFPDWAPRETVARFFHETMAPYNDDRPDVDRALDDTLVPGHGTGGFVMLVGESGRLLGACCMLRTGMQGYIPPWILLYVSVDPETRGRGIGGQLIERCVEAVDGDVKLHVEYDNPAKRLYERIGFTTKYAEMRLQRSGSAR